MYVGHVTYSIISFPMMSLQEMPRDSFTFVLSMFIIKQSFACSFSAYFRSFDTTLLSATKISIICVSIKF